MCAWGLDQQLMAIDPGTRGSGTLRIIVLRDQYIPASGDSTSILHACSLYDYTSELLI
jgi:hypothetical protein